MQRNMLRNTSEASISDVIAVNASTAVPSTTVAETTGKAAIPLSTSDRLSYLAPETVRFIDLTLELQGERKGWGAVTILECVSRTLNRAVNRYKHRHYHLLNDQGSAINGQFRGPPCRICRPFCYHSLAYQQTVQEDRKAHDDRWPPKDPPESEDSDWSSWPAPCYYHRDLCKGICCKAGKPFPPSLRAHHQPCVRVPRTGGWGKGSPVDKYGGWGKPEDDQ